MILSHDFSLLHTNTPSGSVDTKRRREKKANRTNKPTEQTRIENNGVNANCVLCSINTLWRKMLGNFASRCWICCRNRWPERQSTNGKLREVCGRRRMNQIFFSQFEIISFALQRRKQTVRTSPCVRCDKKKDD